MTHPLEERHPGGLAEQVPDLPVALLGLVLLLLPLGGGDGLEVLLLLLTKNLRTAMSTSREHQPYKLTKSLIMARKRPDYKKKELQPS